MSYCSFFGMASWGSARIGVRQDIGPLIVQGIQTS